MTPNGPDVHTSCPGERFRLFVGSAIKLEFFRVTPSHSFRGHRLDRFGVIRHILCCPRMAIKLCDSRKERLGLIGPDGAVRRGCERIRSVRAEVADFPGGGTDVKGVFVG
jgi:hypothetical protein